MESAGVAAVGSREDAAPGIDLDTERVAAALGEDLVPPRLGVVSPDQLAHRVNGLGVDSRPLDVARCCASLAGVQPAVRTPSQAVGHRVRVLETESFEQNDRVRVGDVVVVLVGIEQQVGRVEHEDATASAGEGTGDVQPVDKRLVLVQYAVAVGVLVDRDLVSSADPVGGRQRHLVVDGPQVLVAADHLQPGGIGVLRVVEDPQPASFVPVDEQRLTDQGLGQHLLELQILGDLEALEGLSGSQRIGVSLPPAEIEFDVLDLVHCREICRCVVGQLLRDVACRPVPVVARAVLPFPFGANGPFAGKQDRGGDQEIAAGILHVGSDGDHIDLAEPDRLGGKQKAGLLSKATSILRWKCPGGSDLLSVDECLPSVVDGLDVQFDFLTFPFGRNFDEAAVPRVTVLGGQRSAKLTLPRVGDRHQVPLRSRLLVLGRCLIQQLPADQ